MTNSIIIIICRFYFGFSFNFVSVACGKANKLLKPSLNWEIWWENSFTNGDRNVKKIEKNIIGRKNFEYGPLKAPLVLFKWLDIIFFNIYFFLYVRFSAVLVPIIWIMSLVYLIPSTKLVIFLQ